MSAPRTSDFLNHRMASDTPFVEIRVNRSKRPPQIRTAAVTSRNILKGGSKRGQEELVKVEKRVTRKKVRLDYNEEKMFGLLTEDDESTYGKILFDEMAPSLSDLPTELILFNIFPYLGPLELARLLRVNGRLNILVHTYLSDISTLRMGSRKAWGVCTSNCFRFMTSRTTKLVSFRTDQYRSFPWFPRESRHIDHRPKVKSCITNKEVIKVIERNPLLTNIDLTGLTVTHKLLKLILQRCENLTHLNFDFVGLWGTTQKEVDKDIEKIKEKGIQVKFGYNYVFDKWHLKKRK